MGEATNLEIMQRINAMLENSLDLSNLTGEVASKRNYTGNLSFRIRVCPIFKAFTCRFSFHVGLICRIWFKREQWKSDRLTARRCIDKLVAAASTQSSFEAAPTGATTEGTKSNEIFQHVVAIS